MKQARKIILFLLSLFLPFLFVRFTDSVHAETLKVWEKAENTIFPHTIPESTILPGGNVMVVGQGLEFENEAAEIYDPGTNSWKVSVGISPLRLANTVTSLKDGRVLVAGVGYSLEGDELTSEIYDPQTDTWSDGGDMKELRFIHETTLLQDGRVLVTGGLWFDRMKSAEIYDPETNLWSDAAPMSRERFYHTSTLLNNGKVLVVGGQFNGAESIKSAELYDPQTNKWSSGGNMHVTRYAHTATLLQDGRVLVAGGVEDDSVRSVAEIYDPVTGIWTETGSMNTTRFSHKATLLPDGKVLVTGGSTQNNFSDIFYTNTAEIYDPATREWELINAMNDGRVDHAAELLPNGDVLVIGGFGTGEDWLRSTEILRSSVPAPFLDLPWDYEGQGKEFADVALEINAYFDHSYPLFGSGLGEPFEYLNQITTYMGENTIRKPYSRHDGYDYGSYASGVKNGDSVYPAAAGVAEYVRDRAGGHGIFIDHGNGYQTRYYHLQDIGLITKTPGVKISVNRNTVIGKVGSTGEHTTGPHIHIGVFQDKNKDGNFDDNVPDGATDPFGWQSTEPDPWENYSFLQNGVQKTGNKSYYLWKNKIPNLKKGLSSNGGVFHVANFGLTFPEDESLDGLTLEAKLGPVERVTNSLVSLGPVIDVILKDPLGSLITILTKPLLVTIDFSKADLSRFKPGTISIYSSSDNRKTWTKEESYVDYLNKKASAEMDHLTHFALMGERIDTQPPATTVGLDGLKGENNWFRSDVEVSLKTSDNEGGLGVEIVLYKIEGGEWQEYKEPLNFTEKGEYKIEYYSQDKDGNLEDPKSTEFHIDKTIPEAKIYFDRNKGEMVIEGVDDSGDVVLEYKDLERKREQIVLVDKAGNNLVIENREKENDKRLKFEIYTLTYNHTEFLQEKNKFEVMYEEKKGEIKKLDQNFKIKDQEKVSLKYDIKDNKTKIKENKEKTEADGLKALILFTDQGELKYSF